MHSTALSLSNKAVQRLWNHMKLSQFTDFFTKLIVFDHEDCDVGLCLLLFSWIYFHWGKNLESGLLRGNVRYINGAQQSLWWALSRDTVLVVNGKQMSDCSWCRCFAHLLPAKLSLSVVTCTVFSFIFFCFCILNLPKILYWHQNQKSPKNI